MPSRASPPLSSPVRLVLAALAVLGQLLAGAMVPAAAAATAPAALLGIPEAICHSDAGENDGSGRSPAHHGIDCALCPACLTLAPIALPAFVPVAVPRPRVVLVARPSAKPDATGPPSRTIEIAQPRGPPVQV